jgi:hypothetical protein
MAAGTVVPISHRPSWKVTKNPFHAGLYKFALWKENHPHQRIHPNDSVSGVAGNMLLPYPMQQQQQQQQVQQQQVQQQQVQQQQGEILYAYGENEDVQGVVHLILPHGRKFEHLGVKIQFVGRVDLVSRLYIFHLSFPSFLVTHFFLDLLSHSVPGHPGWKIAS